jgi:putative aldouronate transport system permease protein
LTGGILNAGFDQIYNLYNARIFDTADIIDTYVLRRLQLLDFGPVTAAGLFKNVVGPMLVLSATTIVKHLSRGERGLF